MESRTIKVLESAKELSRQGLGTMEQVLTAMHIAAVQEQSLKLNKIINELEDLEEAVEEAAKGSEG